MSFSDCRYKRAGETDSRNTLPEGRYYDYDTTGTHSQEGRLYYYWNRIPQKRNIIRRSYIRRHYYRDYYIIPNDTGRRQDYWGILSHITGQRWSYWMNYLTLDYWLWTTEQIVEVKYGTNTLSWEFKFCSSDSWCYWSLASAAITSEGLNYTFKSNYYTFC